MLDRPRPRRSPARFLAPLVLVVAIAATYVVVEHAVGGRGGGVHQSSHVARPRHHSAKAAAGHRSTAKKMSKYYTVKSGDTLSGISASTGIPLPTLQTLNPKAASGALQVGQRLRLR